MMRYHWYALSVETVRRSETRRAMTRRPRPRNHRANLMTNSRRASQTLLLHSPLHTIAAWGSRDSGDRGTEHQCDRAQRVGGGSVY
jgi:hypothetical protein